MEGKKYPHERRGGARPNSGPQKGATYEGVLRRKAHAFYTTDDEFEKISENAKKAGKNLSDFVRDRALID